MQREVEERIARYESGKKISPNSRRTMRRVRRRAWRQEEWALEPGLEAHRSPIF